MTVKFPVSTGDLARQILKCPEHRLHDLVRRGIVTPNMVSNRRFWSVSDVLTAAKALGLDGIEVRNLCAAGAEGGDA